MNLPPSSNSGCGLLDYLSHFLLRSSLSLGWCSSLFRWWLSGLSCLFSSTNGLFSLRLPNLRPLVSLSQNVIQRSSNNSPLELLGPAGTFFGSLFFLALLVLAPVKYGPRYFTGVSPHQMGPLAFGVEESESLSIDLYHGFAMARVDFVAAVGAKSDLHLVRK